MSETYNPRDRSFIRRPEPQVCVTCGQPIHPPVIPMRNVMSRYVNDLSGNVVVLNDNADYVEMQGVKLRREDVAKPIAGSPTPIPLTVPSGVPVAPATSNVKLTVNK